MDEFDTYGNFTGTIPDEAVSDCTQPGPANEAAAYWQKRLGFNVPRGLAIAYLYEFGSWEREEMEALGDDELAQVILWTACGAIKESGEWFGLIF